jgi:hypothetical protein
MINATVFFVFFIVIFGFIGTTRGWVKEVLVTFAMMFALFIYILPPFANIINQISNQGSPIVRFFIYSAPFLIITFFGYLSPAVSKSRFERTAANRFEHGLLSFLIGIFNGYLLFSSLALWALNTGVLDAYPNLFMPPQPGGWASFFFIQSAAPVVFSGGLLIFVVVIIFLFVIIVLV